jgi:histidinol-phosphate aminotransferase
MPSPIITNLLIPHIDGIEEYHPIQPLDVLSKRLGIAVDDLVKLDANENPYGPIDAVRHALANFPHYHIYPDPQASELREALGQAMGVNPELVMASQGADELLDYLCRLFLSPGDAVINTPPTFGMYGFDAKLQGAGVINITRDESYAIDTDGIVEAVNNRSGELGAIKLIFLTSPNNPSGNWLDDESLKRILELPAMVVLDEAYVEFADRPSRADWVAQHDNMVVLRTFSKSAGIAGLRLGYGVFPKWLMPTLWKFKQPYNVNVAACVAGLASLTHPDDVARVVTLLKTERARLYQRLTRFECIDAVPGSQANFVLCKVQGRDAKSLKLALEGQGILVRHYSSAGLENCIRISVGRPEQTDALVSALELITKG